MFDSLFNPEMWAQLLEKFMETTLVVAPKLLLLVVVYLLSRRLITLIIGRIQKARSATYESEGDNEGKKRMLTITELLKTTIRVALTIVVILVILGQVGINIGPLLAGAGIVGLAIGFGSQELVRDFITGFFMLIEDQIRVGDVVTINGTTAAVESIELRTITLRDFAGTVHIFQNGKINNVSNLTKEWSAAVFDIGVAYKEQFNHVREVLIRVGEEMRSSDEFGPSMLVPLEVMGLDSFGDNAIVIKVRQQTRPGDQWIVGREFRRRLKEAFDAEGIEIPFPQRTISWSAPLDINKSA